MSDKLRSAEIRIANRTYPVKLDEAEFKQFETIQKQINDRISDYKIKYENLDEQDRIAMVLIANAFELFHFKERQNESKVTEKIGQIQNLIEDNLTQ